MMSLSTWRTINKNAGIAKYISTSFSKNNKMLTNDKKRGALIILEGCDRSGKTTQCQKLANALDEDGIPTKFWRYPDRTTAIGKVIDDYLTRKCELEDHAVHLLFAANRWETVPKMKELLMAGTSLVVDRYSFSGVAFSGAKKELSLDWCMKPEIGLPKPDAVLYLTLSVEEAEKRAAFGGERYEQTDFQLKVAKNYEVLKKNDWKVIDASKSIEDLHQEIKKIAKDIINNVSSNPIGELWTETDLSQENGVKNGSGDIKSEVKNGSGDLKNGVTNGSGEVKNGSGDLKNGTTNGSVDANEPPTKKPCIDV